jgi:hypothetical protein
MNFRATLGLLLLSAAALAGISSTESPTVYMILLADNTVEKGKPWPTTEAECIARAKAIIPQASCSIRRTFTNAGNCADVAKPKWVVEKDADGYLIKPAFRSKFADGSDTEFVHEVEDFVPAPYPECWVKGWRIAELSDFDDEPELASIEEPVWHTPEERAKYDALNAQYNLPENVAAREAYAESHKESVRAECGFPWQASCGGPEVGGG